MKVIKKIILVLLLLLSFVVPLIMVIIKNAVEELSNALPLPISVIIMSAPTIITIIYLLVYVCQKERKNSMEIEELEQKIKLVKERIIMSTISNQANSRYAPEDIQAMKKMLEEMEEELKKLKEMK